MISLRRVLIVAGFALACVSPAWAHHSNAAYDMDQVKTVEGTVKVVNWTNPTLPFASMLTPRMGSQQPNGPLKSQALVFSPVRAGRSARSSRAIMRLFNMPRCVTGRLADI